MVLGIFYQKKRKNKEKKIQDEKIKKVILQNLWF